MDPKRERIYRLLFYESPVLSHKKHTLVATSGKGGRVIVDYITITSALLNTFSACVTQLCGSENDTTSISTSTSTVSTAHANIGIIVGGILGGRLALVGLLGVIWRLWH